MGSLIDIKSEIEDLIEDITTDNGYAYDWGSINQPDQALQTYPSADIQFISDKPVDNLALSQYGYAQAEFTIKIKCALASTEAVPNRAIEEELEEKLADVKKVLLAYNGDLKLDGTAIITYQGSEPALSNAGDRFVPGELTTRWLVQYKHVSTYVPPGD